MRFFTETRPRRTQETIFDFQGTIREESLI